MKITINKDQINKIEKKNVEDWDLSLLVLVSQTLKYINSKTSKVLRDGRNAVAHSAGNKLSNDEFDKYFLSFKDVLINAFGCESSKIMLLRSAPLDDNTEIGISNEKEAIQLAQMAKEEGNRFFKSGNLLMAEDEYSKGISLRGAIRDAKRLLAELYLNRSQTRTKLRKLSQAIEDAKESTLIDNSWFKSHFRLAEIYHNDHEYVIACKSYETALSLLPSNDKDFKIHISKLLDECRYQADRISRGESFNLQYSIAESSFGGLNEAIRASQGFGQSKGPRDNDQILKMLDHIPGLCSKGVRCTLDAKRFLADGNFQMAIQKYTEGAVVHKNPDSMYNLSLIYMNGIGCAQNPALSVSWCKKAIECLEPPPNTFEHITWKAGVSFAYNALGKAYDLGISVEKSPTTSFEFYNKSAELGCSAGQNNLGCYYLNGIACLKSISLAKDYFRLAIENETPANEAMVGMASIRKRYLEFDAAERWLKTAVNYGLIEAESSLKNIQKIRQNLPENKIDEILPEIKDLVFKFQKIISVPTPFVASKISSFSELTKISKPSPYILELIRCKEEFHKITEGLEHGLILDPIFFEKIISNCVEVFRSCDDAFLVSNFEVVKIKEIAKEFHPNLENSNVRILKDVSIINILASQDIEMNVLLLKKLAQEFPNDAYIAEFYGKSLMFQTKYMNFELGVAELTRALSLINDDASPQVISLLYSLGAACYKIENNIYFKRSKSFLDRYLKVAVSYGHRNVSNACYILSMSCIRENLNMKQAEIYFKKGLEFKKNLSNIFQLSEPFYLESTLEFFFPSMTSEVNGEIKLNTSIFGGQVLGNRANLELINESPYYLHLKRLNIVNILKMNHRQGKIIKSTLHLDPDLIKTEDVNKDYNEVFVDELISHREDKVFSGRKLKCLIISPILNVVAANFLVEDEMRDSINLAIYEAPTSFLDKLEIGSVLEIRNPHLRISKDFSFNIRVDNYSKSIRLTKEKISLCWTCLKISERLLKCSGCNRAKYCSKKCGSLNWDTYGHKYICKS